MPAVADLTYEKPATLDELLKICSSGKKARFLAGGTDLIPRWETDMQDVDTLIDIKGIDELKGIKMEGDKLIIGSLTTLTELHESALVKNEFPVLWEATCSFASVSIRNRATIGGNICNAIPCADTAPPCLIYNSVARIINSKGERGVPLKDFFLGNRRTALNEKEVLKQIILEKPTGKNGGAFVKLKRYRGEDLAQASIAILITEKFNYSLAFGSLAATPRPATKIQDLLKGRELSSELIQEAKSLVKDEISPITDVRASREYRQLMSEIMLERGLETASKRLQKIGPDYGHSII
ncbi:MAG: FAD binding domain-containing protein [Vulcanimicrobiota bacterium]